MPRAHEHWKHCQMDLWGPNILAPRLFIGPKCASLMSNNNRHDEYPWWSDIVCVHTALSLWGTNPFTHRVVWEVPQCGALDPAPPWGQTLTQASPGCSDWFRDVHMTQAQPIRVLQGLVSWSCFLPESWCQRGVKLRLPAVIFFEHREKDGSWQE